MPGRAGLFTKPVLCRSDRAVKRRVIRPLHLLVCPTVGFASKNNCLIKHQDYCQIPAWCNWNILHRQTLTRQSALIRNLMRPGDPVFQRIFFFSDGDWKGTNRWGEQMSCSAELKSFQWAESLPSACAGEAVSSYLQARSSVVCQLQILLHIFTTLPQKPAEFSALYQCRVVRWREWHDHLLHPLILQLFLKE